MPFFDFTLTLILSLYLDTQFSLLNEYTFKSGIFSSKCFYSVTCSLFKSNLQSTFCPDHQKHKDLMTESDSNTRHLSIAPRLADRGQSAPSPIRQKSESRRDEPIALERVPRIKAALCTKATAVERQRPSRG